MTKLADFDSTTTFTVRFRFNTSGVRTANLHIASNDADRNPYDITLTGSALPLNWQPQTSAATNILSNVQFLNSATGWAVGYGTAIYKTTDGGTTWIQHSSGGNDSLSGLSFVDTNTGWVSGYYGELRKTTNGGATWEVEFSNTRRNT